jgi:ABC-type methionine transport system ATPase subunit
MAIESYNLTFTKDMADRPVLFNLSKKFNLTCNLRKAQLSEGAGWVQLSLSGERDEIQRAIAELLGQGVMVAPLNVNSLTSDHNPMP